METLKDVIRGMGLSVGVVIIIMTIGLVRAHTTPLESWWIGVGVSGLVVITLLMREDERIATVVSPGREALIWSCRHVFMPAKES